MSEQAPITPDSTEQQHIATDLPQVNPADSAVQGSYGDTQTHETQAAPVATEGRSLDWVFTRPCLPFN